MTNIIYVAIDKKTGSVVTGSNGQAAYANRSYLGRSMGQTLGKGSKEKYDILEIHVENVRMGVASV